MWLRKTLIALCCGARSLDEVELRANTTEAVKVTGIWPAVIYGYERTELIVAAKNRT